MVKSPFKTPGRRFIPFHEHEALSYEQQSRTLTGRYLSTEPREILEARIAALKDQEAASGFVYRGGRRWLEAFLQSGRFIRYDEWVFDLFAELEITFAYVDYSETAGFAKKAWFGELSAALIPVDEGVLKPTFSLDTTLELSVFGTAEGPAPAHLVELYACLGCFDAVAAMLSDAHTAQTAVEITGVALMHPAFPQVWSVELMSEYGAEWDQTIPRGRGE